MILLNPKELISKLEEEREFEIMNLGKTSEYEELISIGATVYTLSRVINTIKELEGMNE